MGSFPRGGSSPLERIRSGWKSGFWARFRWRSRASGGLWQRFWQHSGGSGDLFLHVSDDRGLLPAADELRHGRGLCSQTWLGARRERRLLVMPSTRRGSRSSSSGSVGRPSARPVPLREWPRLLARYARTRTLAVRVAGVLAIGYTIVAAVDGGYALARWVFGLAFALVGWGLMASAARLSVSDLEAYRRGVSVTDPVSWLDWLFGHLRLRTASRVQTVAGALLFRGRRCTRGRLGVRALTYRSPTVTRRAVRHRGTFLDSRSSESPLLRNRDRSIGEGCRENPGKSTARAGVGWDLWSLPGLLRVR